MEVTSKRINSENMRTPLDTLEYNFLHTVLLISGFDELTYA